MEWKRGTYSVTTLEPLALETSLVEWKLFYADGFKYSERLLGNFLSGMETPFSMPPEGIEKTLETSLVEWKLGAVDDDPLVLRSLETSLVEWKRAVEVTC